MKRTKFLSVITMSIAVVLIVAGYLVLFINDYTVEAEETNYYASMIKNSYGSYYNDLERISFDIKGTNIFNITYYEQIRTNYLNDVSEIASIEDKLHDVAVTVDSFKDACLARDYNDQDIEQKCMKTLKNYESVTNAYVSLVNKYNERIDNYNQSTIQKTLTKYDSRYFMDYVDVDDDGVYSGIIK